MGAIRAQQQHDFLRQLAEPEPELAGPELEHDFLRQLEPESSCQRWIRSPSPSSSPAPPPTFAPLPEYVYEDGPQVANSQHSQCSEWYGTLEDAKAMCNADADCQTLHDFGCDGQNWRFCSVTISAMQAAGGGTDACTMRKAHVYVHGPFVANSRYSQCSEWYGTLEDAKAMCNADADCQTLHDFGCDGQNWRFCSVTASSMQAAGGGTDACTIAKNAV